MKLKFYMRGLGAGIVITTLIMGVINKPETLSDAEIKLRASKLGMVEDGVLAKVEDKHDNVTSNGGKEQETDIGDISNEDSVAVNETAEVTEEIINDKNENNEKEHSSETDLVDEDIQQTDSQDIDFQENEKDNKALNSDYNAVNGNSEALTDTKESQINEENVENYIVIAIESGNAAQTVSKKLAEVGLVDSASDYSEYLSLNGYSKMLRVGQHEIPMGASYEKIARILCELD